MFCNICIEELNESEIKKCLFCDYITCENCLKKYILDTKKTEKSCMNCKNIFLRSAEDVDIRFSVPSSSDTSGMEPSKNVSLSFSQDNAVVLPTGALALD